MNERYTLIPNEAFDKMIGANVTRLEDKILCKLLQSVRGNWEYSEPISIKDIEKFTGDSMNDILTAFINIVKYNVGYFDYSFDDTEGIEGVILLGINLDWESWKLPRNNWRGCVAMNDEVKEMAKQIIGNVIEAENSYIEVVYRNGNLQIKDTYGDEDSIDFSENLYEIEPEYMAEEVGVASEQLKVFVRECDRYNALNDEE